ncbi:MAG: Cysteine desulfurase NifS [Prosthecobacter sp.]|nr:Cysteine desulfurase NifS [Prosthecobacter sp.]
MTYLDANATTPVLPAVLEAMLPWLTQRYANASAGHAGGRQARRAVEAARSQVAELIGARSDEVIFTSGATEGIASVLLFAQAEWPDRPLLVISAVEHAAVLEGAARWEQRGGRVKRIPVDAQGRLNLDAFKHALEPGRTALVSMIWGNNETGVVSPMAEVAEAAHAAGALVHADAVQMAGKLPVDVRQVPVDYLSLSGHKMYAPKGCGVLWVSHQAPFRPLLVGGGQESGRRSGTENVPGIVALGRAALESQAWLQQDGPMQMAALRDAFEDQLLTQLPGSVIHGREALRLPNTTSVSLPGVDAAGMLILLDQRGIACSGGSACHTAALHPSPVLEAMGCSAGEAACTLRFSLSRLNSREEVLAAADTVLQAARHLAEQKNLSVI